MRRSRQLAAGHYVHIFGFMILVGLLVAVPAVTGALAVSGHDALALPFAGGVAVHTITASVGALTTAVLYFDLVARHEQPNAEPG